MKASENYSSASDQMFYVQTSFYGFLILDIVMLIIAILLIFKDRRSKLIKLQEETAADADPMRPGGFLNQDDELLHPKDTDKPQAEKQERHKNLYGQPSPNYETGKAFASNGFAL